MLRITSKIGATLKGKNLLQEEQILSFKSSPYGKEAKYFYVNATLLQIFFVRMVRICVMCVIWALRLWWGIFLSGSTATPHREDKAYVQANHWRNHNAIIFAHTHQNFKTTFLVAK